MNKKILKKKILQSVKTITNNKIDGLQQEMMRLQNNNPDPDKEYFSLAYKSQDEADHELTNTLINNLNIAKNELLTIEQLEDQYQLMNEIAPGAVVKTDKGTFFISVATKSFVVEDLDIIGLSPNAPIYKVMHGKKKNEKFFFRNNEFLVEDLF
jgi:hypothetical protein